MSLSIIVPTMGRPSLLDTLISIESQLGNEDEVLIITDGTTPQAGMITSLFDKRFKLMESSGPALDWGATPRNYGIDHAHGSHLAFMDDDDVYLPGAFDAFRRAIVTAPDQPHIFRMYREGCILWQFQVVRGANVSTQMYLIPNLPGRVGRWTTCYDGDWYFLLDTLRSYPEGEASIVWHEEIIAELTLHRRGEF